MRSESACLISAVRNGRGSRLCGDDANSNALESKPSKRDRHNSPAHRRNKAGHPTSTFTMTALAIGVIAASTARIIPIFNFIPYNFYIV